MIITKEFKIKIPVNLSSDYIENELKASGYDVLKWAITSYDDEYFFVCASIVTDK